MSCSCEGSDFVDKDHQHIATGNLWINKKWGSCLPRALNTAGAKAFNAKVDIIEGLNYSINAWCKKHGADKPILIKFKYKVISKIGEKIKILSINTSGKY